MLHRLETAVPAAPGRPDPDPAHPMRAVTMQVAFDADGWTPDRAAKVAELFDGLAAEWHTKGGRDRTVVLADALERGGPFARGRCLEVGAGVGLYTALLAERFGDVVAVDLSGEMLRHGTAAAPRVQADAARLPFPDGSFTTIVAVNMFLFPAETDRLLRRDGALVWVNTHGPATPINLSAEEVERAMPGRWDGVHADAGWGWWTALHRT